MKHEICEEWILKALETTSQNTFNFKKFLCIASSRLENTADHIFIVNRELTSSAFFVVVQDCYGMFLFLLNPIYLQLLCIMFLLLFWINCHHINILEKSLCCTVSNDIVSVITQAMTTPLAFICLFSQNKLGGRQCCLGNSNWRLFTVVTINHVYWTESWWALVKS